MDPVNIHANRRGISLAGSTEDSMVDLTTSDPVRDVAPEPKEPDRDIFAIARVIAERGYRHRNLCRASSIV